MDIYRRQVAFFAILILTTSVNTAAGSDYAQILIALSKQQPTLISRIDKKQITLKEPITLKERKRKPYAKSKRHMLYGCLKCSQEATNLTTMEYHCMNHLDSHLLPFLCTLCKKSLRNWSYVRMHFKSQHPSCSNVWDHLQHDGARQNLLNDALHALYKPLRSLRQSARQQR